MSRKSGYRFSDRGHAPCKESRACSDSVGTEHALGHAVVLRLSSIENRRPAIPEGLSRASSSLRFRAFTTRPAQGKHSMAISMYKVSVPIFAQFLTAQSDVIDKVVAHIEAKKVDPGFLFNMRFYPDMYPYCRQVQQAST